MSRIVIGTLQSSTVIFSFLRQTVDNIIGICFNCAITLYLISLLRNKYLDIGNNSTHYEVYRCIDRSTINNIIRSYCVDTAGACVYFIFIYITGVVILQL